eukprot:CAMPEP_0185707398 /NCGR_PEP_ID=MMETSP1164-20130828/24119_1 /TAXON_ID=1104430 /ORGANISM="Chrysoreinhardia sp, Strain CCMP2950" /LENGTH=45 /DNA_ID= /DNA_START= /DNA_END= /DNA_ORIENTATION=
MATPLRRGVDKRLDGAQRHLGRRNAADKPKTSSKISCDALVSRGT